MYRYTQGFLFVDFFICIGPVAMAWRSTDYNESITQPRRPAVVAFCSGVSDDDDHIVAFKPVILV